MQSLRQVRAKNNSRLSRDLKRKYEMVPPGKEEKKKKNRASLSLFTWYRANFSKRDARLESKRKKKLSCETQSSGPEVKV